MHYVEKEDSWRRWRGEDVQCTYVHALSVDVKDGTTPTPHQGQTPWHGGDDKLCVVSMSHL